jgi:hypothetical protein
MLVCLTIGMACAQSPDSPAIAALLKHQYDLKTEGRDFLLAEARRVSLFAMGELHGENEIPDLLRALWPSLWSNGYRHVAAELSPWAARRLEFERSKSPTDGHGLWRNAEAETVTALKNNSPAVLWGCDIEDLRPGELIRELALGNAKNKPLQIMAEKTAQGYRRSAASELRELALQAIKEISSPGAPPPLLRDLLQTLDVESLRSSTATRFEASTRRELVMKQLFLENYRRAGGTPKVFARFGRNHLHRGYDRRGVSTLGNFLAEFAAAQGDSSFHVAAFGAGGKILTPGGVIDWDETKDDPAFALLASQARFDASVFDLRPIRPILHQIPEAKLSPAEASLMYWSDSYDAIICYRHVTPLHVAPLP